ncbi:unnamed protein product [Dovyalis caffra]|uniref:Uncharacterized protein n=1 Tax=Dovyalis caffra TaxID=77055 RepID=A0AAV1QXN6_9ROSI|nr:unnamed protein product [Dovyalis caffra]
MHRTDRQQLIDQNRSGTKDETVDDIREPDDNRITWTSIEVWGKELVLISPKGVN